MMTIERGEAEGLFSLSASLPRTLCNVIYAITHVPQCLEPIIYHAWYTFLQHLVAPPKSRAASPLAALLRRSCQELLPRSQLKTRRRMRSQSFSAAAPMSGDACGHRSVCLKKEMDVHVCNFFSLCNFLMESRYIYSRSGVEGWSQWSFTLHSTTLWIFNIDDMLQDTCLHSCDYWREIPP